MVQTIALTGFAEGARRSRWETVFLFSVGALASTVVLKIASIQYLEILYLVQFAILFFAFYRTRLRTVVFRPLLVLGIGYSLIAMFALVLALTALRFTFYMPPDQPILQRPVLITLSRVVELLLDAGMMLYMAGLFRERLEMARFTMRVYYWIGVVSVLYSVLSYPLDRAGIISLGTYDTTHRFRGFYNEGGPYGLYLITLLAVAWALTRLCWEPPRRTYLLMGLIGIALVMAQSKAALSAIVILFLLRSLFARSFTQRITTFIVSMLFVVLVSQTFDLGAKLRLYQQAGDSYERASHLHVGDANFVQGRVAGFFIVPRMIAAHPWTGIGWGNYGILRNDPQYRGASAWGEPDEPGLGIVGLTAETGLPLVIFILMCLFTPYFWLRSLHVPEYIANLALLQPVVHIFGAQLNLTYPWIATAFALGLGYALTRRKKSLADAREIATT